MESSEPQRPIDDEADTLRQLGDRLERASDAAERLIAEAATAAARAAAGGARLAGETSKPPPAGWQIPGDSAAQPTPATEPLAQILHSLRDLIPPELRQRLAEAVRELLLALRALIDWYVERLERRRAQPVEVQDIPIV